MKHQAFRISTPAELQSATTPKCCAYIRRGIGIPWSYSSNEIRAEVDAAAEHIAQFALSVNSRTYDIQDYYSHTVKQFHILRKYDMVIFALAVYDPIETPFASYPSESTCFFLIYPRLAIFHINDSRALRQIHSFNPNCKLAVGDILCAITEGKDMAIAYSPDVFGDNTPKCEVCNKDIREFLNAEQDSADISLIISRGESQKVEFKSTFRWSLRDRQKSAAVEFSAIKAIVGFLNARGGFLLIGVGDDGSILGLDNDLSTFRAPSTDKFQLHLLHVLNEEIGADLVHHVKVEFPQVSGKAICWITVSAAPRPVWIIRKNSPELYVRQGNQTIAMDTRQTVEYIQQRWGRPRTTGKEHR